MKHTSPNVQHFIRGQGSGHPMEGVIRSLLELKFEGLENLLLAQKTPDSPKLLFIA